jgi:predicted Zn-dependent peptidase
VHVALGFEAPGYRAPDFYTAQIYSQALGGGMSSRLFQEAREKRGLCYAIFSQAGAYADSGLITVYAGTSGADIRALSELVVDEMRRLGAEITEAEVLRARAQMKAGLLMSLESPSARAERIARLTAIWGRVPGIEETIALIEAVGRPEVTAFADRLAGAGRPALALYGPVKSAPALEALAGRLAA